MTETPQVRLKRLKIRSWRRGTREMDMILGPFFDAEGAKLTTGQLDAYEVLLEENDQDLYAWFSGRADIPSTHAQIIQVIEAFERNFRG